MQPLRSRSDPAPWAGILFGLLFLTVWFWTPIVNTFHEWFPEKPVPALKPYSFALQQDGLNMILSPDGNFIASSGEKEFALWDVHSRKIITRIALDRTIERFQYSNDGRSLIMILEDSIKIWDTQKWSIAGSFDPAEFQRYGILTALSSASSDQLIGILMQRENQFTTIYDIKAAKKLFQLGEEYRSQVGFDSSSQWLSAYSRQRKQVALWNIVTGLQAETIPVDEFAGGLRVSPNGRFIAWNARGRVMLYDRESHTTRTIYYDTPFFRQPLTAFSPDSGKFAVTLRDGIHLFATATGEKVSLLLTSHYDYKSLNFSQDGFEIAGNYYQSSTVDIWDLREI